MTVCAAAICMAGTQQMLLGISDRMLTSGDIEFETGQTKVFGFSPNIFAQFAGDSDAHFAVATETHLAVLKNGISSVGEVARLYAQNALSLRRRRAEGIHLAPLGLDTETFISRQQELLPELALSLAERLENEVLGLEAIIAGVDASGPHIYSVGGPPGLEEHHQAVCRDMPGFWAIGSGARQFETMFMYQRYYRFCPFLDALLLMYSAKRRAEVSPGVGSATDVLVLGGDSCGFLSPTAIAALEEHHRTFEEAIAKEMARTVEGLANDARISQRAEVVKRMDQSGNWVPF